MLWAQSNPFSRLNLQFDPPVPWRSDWGPVFWTVLAGIPVTIILLYFLKLRRRPVQVPSTFLWRKSIEDLHVNSLFQRLRRNLLLFLQLLAILLVALALLGPQVKGSAKLGQRYVIAIDHSASMAATDVRPNRLAEAKDRALELVDSMGANDLAMVIAFSDSARVVSPYTANTRQLTDRIAGIQPTTRSTSLREALQVAAGLANPSRQFFEGQTTTDLPPPQLRIYTDGGFPNVEGFSLGNLVPELVVIGEPNAAVSPTETEDEDTESASESTSALPSNNVALLALRTARLEDQPDRLQLFGRVRNYRVEPVQTTARLYLHSIDEPQGTGQLIDAVELSIPAQDDQSFKFDISDPGTSGLEVRLDIEDDLTLDNRAFAAIGRQREAQVLLVSDRNPYLRRALTTVVAGESAELSIITPEDLATNKVRQAMTAGLYDLVIFDRVSPEQHPTANTLYFGAMPPGEAFAEAETVEGPVILDWDIAHPMLNYVRDLGVILIRQSLVLDPPPGSSVLINSDQGPLAFVTPREGFSDAVVGFGIYDDERNLNTDWHTKTSFPIFLFNSLRLLGNVQDALGAQDHHPGDPVILRAEPSTQEITVEPPEGSPITIERTDRGTFPFQDADQPGLYWVSWDDEVRTVFAVNLFNSRESNIAPRGLVPEGVTDQQAEDYQIQIGYTAVEGTRETVPARRNWWWAIALAALGVLLVEWYIYNRRVYV